MKILEGSGDKRWRIRRGDLEDRGLEGFEYELGVFLFLYGYGVGKSVFIVVEEGVGDGIGYVGMVGGGVGGEIGGMGGGGGREDIGYVLMGMGEGVGGVWVKDREE